MNSNQTSPLLGIEPRFQLSPSSGRHRSTIEFVPNSGKTFRTDNSLVNASNEGDRPGIFCSSNSRYRSCEIVVRVSPLDGVVGIVAGGMKVGFRSSKEKTPRLTFTDLAGTRG